jgi:hypothetical protein
MADCAGLLEAGETTLGIDGLFLELLEAGKDMESSSSRIADVMVGVCVGVDA